MPRGKNVFVILEGEELKSMRFICVYADFDQACTFSQSRLRAQLQRLTLRDSAQYKIEHSRKSIGHVYSLIREKDNLTKCNYVVHKTTIL